MRIARPCYDANTVSILDGVNEAIVELNAGPLAEAGLEIDFSFDASVHIRRAIALVAATVPLSLLVAFIALSVFDKSLNVISLASRAIPDTASLAAPGDDV